MTAPGALAFLARERRTVLLHSLLKRLVMLMSVHWAGSFSIKCGRQVILSQRI
jgi:hypothetical protein